MVHAELRDEWVDDGRDGVTAELDYVQFEVRPAVVPVALGPDAPSVVRVASGESVSWTNSSAEAVELALEGALRGEKLGELAPGASLSRCFVTPGVVEWRAGPNRGELVVVGEVHEARATRSGGGIWRFELPRQDGGARFLRWQLRLRDAAGNERITPGGQLELR